MRHTFRLAAPATLAEMPADGGSIDAGFAVPEWVNILPLPDADDRIVSRDYRTLVVDDMAKLVRRSNAALKKQGGGGLVDKDHRSYGYFVDGTTAIGWAEEYALRDDGIYARTMWLPEGREAVAAGQYRYTSSVINGPQEWVYDENGYPTRLDIFPQEIEGFGITNTPALTTLAMFAADEDAMEKKIIETALAKLGLCPAALAALAEVPIEQLRQRLTASPATRAMFTADAPAVDVEPPEAEDIDPPAGDLGDLVVVAELSSARARIVELEADIAKLTAHAADSLVAGLVHSGKVTPAQRADVLAIASLPGGAALVTKLYDKAPPVIAAAAPRVTAKTTPDASAFGTDPFALQLAREGKTITEITLALKQRAQETSR